MANCPYTNMPWLSHRIQTSELFNLIHEMQPVRNHMAQVQCTHAVPLIDRGRKVRHRNNAQRSSTAETNAYHRLIWQAKGQWSFRPGQENARDILSDSEHRTKLKPTDWFRACQQQQMVSFLQRNGGRKCLSFESGRNETMRLDNKTMHSPQEPFDGRRVLARAI